jgi:hypothetical protein
MAAQAAVAAGALILLLLCCEQPPSLLAPRTLSGPAPMLTLAAIVLAGTALASPAAALPRGGWYRAEMLSRISSLEHTFVTRTAEVDSKFTAQQGQLQAAFKRDTAKVDSKFSAQQRHLEAVFQRAHSTLRRDFKREASRLRAAMDSPSDPGGGEHQEAQQDPVKAWHPVRRLQGDGEGSSSVCSSTAQATAALQTVQTVCCTQRGESCSSSHYPVSCDHGPECGLAVHAVARLCSPFLQSSMISAALVPLQQAATLCTATSPPDMVAVHTLSDAARGGTSVPHACFSTLRTQVGG